MPRTVKNPVPDPSNPGGADYGDKTAALLTELSRMTENSALAGDVDAVAQTVAALPTPAMVASTATAQANAATVRRTASAVNKAAVTVPGLGMADVVLTLDTPLQSPDYVPVAGVPMVSTTTLLGAVSVVAVTARTTTTMTAKLRNTGATALTVPAGAITAAAIHAP